MRHRPTFRLLVSLTGLAAVAACSDREAITSPLAPDARVAEARADGPSAQAVPILYWGGPIMPKPRIVTVYWGSTPIYQNAPAPGTYGSSSSDNSIIGYFLKNLGGTPWWGINTDYRDAVTGPVRYVQNYLAYTAYWANNASVPAPGSTVTEAAIRAMLVSGFTSGKIQPNDSTMYAVFSDTLVNLGGKFYAGSGQCAHHGHFSPQVNGVTYSIKYLVMPHQVDITGCVSVNKTVSPNNDLEADAEINSLAHEMTETVTDPELNAWMDNAPPSGQENADKCHGTFGLMGYAPNGSRFNVTIGLRKFLIQQNWKIGPNYLVQVGCAMS